MTDKELKDAAAATPDPERAFKNLRSFCDKNPGHTEHLIANLRQASLLFSYSQFLANFSFSHPDEFFFAAANADKPLDKDLCALSLSKELRGLSDLPMEKLSGIIRIFKKKGLLLITLRDILGRADISEIMQELSILADVIIGEAVRLVHLQLREVYGEPEADAFAVMAVGKLGGNELNFSSDVDLLYVYGTEQGETSGIMRPGGIITNRISNHEYYCKLGENLNKFLSLNTEDGFAYRVDLRLRPEGQRGSIAISLPAYEIYYESWGRAWERAVFLRARHIAGDARLGNEFIEMLKPFVYRKYLDFSAIDEIRTMKTKIDSAFKKDDIKRGYGGIREIEFFVHAHQLIYGGKEPFVREGNLLRSLHRLLQKKLIGHGDCAALSDNYIFLRKLEHRLQQLNDLQTHSLPASENELAALSRKMGFQNIKDFTEELDSRRKTVRHIYDSLFTQRKEETSAEISVFFAEEVSDAELTDIISRYPVKDANLAIRNIRHIKDSIHTFQTNRSRKLLNEILQDFLLEALKSKHPDSAINNLQSFAMLLASEESYLELFSGNKGLIPVLVSIFAQSEYLSKTIIRKVDYLELLSHEMFLKNTLDSLKKNLRETIASGQSIADSIRLMKQMEEIRLGVLFLDKQISTIRLTKGLSKTAEAIVAICMEQLSGVEELAVIGLGKAGGRELTFSSDLDLIFVSGRDVRDGQVRAAERLIRLLISYTKDGIAYSVDTRLRPEGTRGPLVSSVIALEDYYSKAAQFWELQALLKARPLAGDKTTASHFMEMQRDLLQKLGQEVSAPDIKEMREKIQKKLSREGDGYDLKLGPGGLEDIEFLVQYLQLKNCRRYKNLLVQGTAHAIKRLLGSGLMDKKESTLLIDAYYSYRTLESFMRLSGEPILKKNSPASADASEFMGFKDAGYFFEQIKKTRKIVSGLFEKFLA